PVWIRSAPLEIADMLIDGLWQKLDSALLTSATLATTNTASGFTHILKSLGLNQFPPERVRTSIFGSPFDYANNCLVGYPTFFPSPSDLPADHMTAVSNMCAEIAMRHKTGMLVLFTSYKALRQVERDLKKILLGKDIEILVQRGGRNRDMLIRRLRSANGKAILLGTDSFWEGIDVPGPALQVVVIPKLPFAVPNDPIVAARINKLRREGGNPFMEYQLPNAVLKVRQGAGRLIRTVTDRGVILMLDARILTKRYGDIFYRTLPGKASQFENTESLLEAMDAYISDNTTDE
ncbi:MAG: helicase, partial [Calditrichaeota bacterium]|nr:helicase [Calditrichota bacterium]